MQVSLESLPEDLQKVFSFAKRYLVSDIYLKEGSLPYFKLPGLSGKAPLLAFTLAQKLGRELSEEEKRELPQGKVTKSSLLKLVGELEGKNKDFSLELTKSGKVYGRFRVNVCYAMGKLVVTLRRLFATPPTIDELLLPLVLKEIKDFSSGLVLVVGATGTGKSTTLSSIINLLTEENRVVVTIENPVEYVFPDKSSLVVQREVGSDVESFVAGVYTALRQNPDVILIGEVRSQEEIRASLTASETGHLTLTTLHTTSAVSTISRIVDSFPADEQPAVRVALAEELRLIVAQRLVPTKTGGIRAVCEVLYVDEDVRRYIRNNELEKIKQHMERQGGDSKSQLLNDVLYRLVTENVIEEKVAIRASYNPKELIERLGTSLNRELL